MTEFRTGRSLSKKSVQKLYLLQEGSALISFFFFYYIYKTYHITNYIQITKCFFFLFFFFSINRSSSEQRLLFKINHYINLFIGKIINI